MNTSLRIRLVDCTSVRIEEREAVARVFAASFHAGDRPDRVLRNYFDNVQSLLLADYRGEVVGFQFYQILKVSGHEVHHFSLAGRLPDPRFRGIQARFGLRVIRGAAFTALRWRPVYVVGVCNSPRSYANFYALGCRCYPDIMSPMAENPFGFWYWELADALGMFVDSRGVVPGRMREIGFNLRTDRGKRHPLADAYDAYVDGDRDQGVFTLLEFRPLLDLPAYLMRQVANRPPWKQTIRPEDTMP